MEQFLPWRETGNFPSLCRFHCHSRDDPMSSQQLDDWFRLFSTLQAVEESYKESTYTITFLRSEAVSQNPTTCPSQKRCKDHELIVSAHHENVLKPRTSKQKQIFTWLKNVLLKPFREFFSLSCALKEIWCRKKHEAKLLKPKSHFDFVLDERCSKSVVSHCFPNSFTAWPDFEIDKQILGNYFTCLMFAHVLDDYPKSLDPVFDDLRLEKPFDYFFADLLWFL